jgi:putative addiction module killer protein
VVIERRLMRIENGNLGQVCALRKGVWEIKVDVGPGYRVYYA